MKILDGKLVAGAIKERVRADVAAMAAIGKGPVLATILVGDNPASQIYIKNKIRACHDLGIESRHFDMSVVSSEEDIIAKIQELNNDTDVNGILLQLPLPDGINTARCLDAINPAKDVDGLHPVNLGKLMRGDGILRPCTPTGIMSILEYYKIPVAGKNAVVVGRSVLVGKPTAALLTAADATVTIAHSKTQDLAAVCRGADILVVAVGCPKFITREFIKPGAVVIDVGINRDADGKLCGDVDFDDALDIAGAITPVPGGVGPTTIATLMSNTVISAKKQFSAVLF